MKRTKAKKTDRKQTRLGTFQSRPGTCGKPLTTCFKARGRTTRFPPFNTEVTLRTRTGGRRGRPARRTSICALESVVTFRTRFGTFQTRPCTSRTRLMGKLQSPGPTETHLPLSYGDTLQTRVGGGVNPPTHENNPICALVSVVSNASWYISTAIGGKLTGPGPTVTLRALFHSGALQMRVGGGGVTPPAQIPVAPWYP